MTPGQAPEKEDVRPSGLTRWMVKHSLRANVRDEGLAAFEDEFQEHYATTGDLSETRSWAMRTAWDSLHYAYKPFIDIGMYVLAVLGFIMAAIALF